MRNPCAVGTCVNDGKGSYSCVCPPGFRQGTTVDGTYSCTPGDTSRTFTVVSDNVLCSDIYPVYGLTQVQFQAQNPSLSCPGPLALKAVVNVVSPNNLPPCSVYFTVVEAETCSSLATYFVLTDGCPTAGQPCSQAFQALNPGIDCSASLPLNQAVCVERSKDKAKLIPVCSQYYLVQSGETCESMRNVPNPPLSAVDFFRLNPGIKCNRLIPNTDVAAFTGFEACIASDTSYTAGTCPRTNAYTVSTSDRCSSIQVRYFKGIKGCYKRINGYDCLDTLVKGSKVCLPNAAKLAYGQCTV
eukprot:TRINITY_DN11274_c0_g1_i8.p1 TRINITY_DN11274_c0_g1~~TRINITY_DN11274_c0_g1_i8.p1  ORF type:complete len:332 (+),score=6.12 TRINITY_DN11274_c0_g1_i8:97-996(+)